MEEWIKKSDAIKAIKDHSFALGDDYMEINGYGAIDDIRALPSADRPRGEWIETTMVDCGAPIWLCSMCEYESYGTYNFCPSCGARMKGADDEESM